VRRLDVTDRCLPACERAQQHGVIALLVVLAVASFFMAIWQRHQGITQKQHWPWPSTAVYGERAIDIQNHLLSLLRGTCSAGAFVALALLTPPGPTCLFPDRELGPKHTRVPSSLPSYVLGMIVVALSWLSAKVPGLVTDAFQPEYAALHAQQAETAAKGAAEAADEARAASERAKSAAQVVVARQARRQAADHAAAATKAAEEADAAENGVREPLLSGTEATHASDAAAQQSQQR